MGRTNQKNESNKAIKEEAKLAISKAVHELKESGIDATLQIIYAGCGKKHFCIILSNVRQAQKTVIQ